MDFKAWWESPDVISFWASLPDDAGFWRETVSLPATRAMYMCNKETPQGFGHCGELIPLTEKMGYWGAYRSPLTPETPDTKFASPLPTLPEPRPLSDEIRRGRTRITKFPDNICFVVEGQDYVAIPPPERAYWDENFDGLAKQWITNVMTAGSAKGLVSGRACHAFGSGKQLGASSRRVTTQDANGHGATANGHDAGEDGDAVNSTPKDPSPLFPGLDYTRQAQLLFWLDLSYMEHLGRWDEVHRKLRRGFLEAYGPHGAMQGGDLLLWVDLGVLKADELDAEYVGCCEGTGFMAYDHDAAFVASRRDARSAGLPAFFDEARGSRPMEW
ncbi:hypothetical protein PG991_007751 [Apiospora marii]|uniref:Uncharacterized protein n=2 Tax=Apiospora marii TaxID=335849 RepID=A0ABR1RVI7_9PEZI